jgi:predicted small metal-binding protein
MKTIACQDAGFDCDHGVLDRGKEHLIKEHGMKEHIASEMKEKARRAIHTS